MSAAHIRALARDGVLTPQRRGRALRFSFADLAVLRVAQRMTRDGVPVARLRRSLTDLRQRLPDDQPLSAQGIEALGGAVVARDARSAFEVDTRQRVLDLDRAGGGAEVIRAFDEPAWRLLDEALAMEMEQPEVALRLYREALAQDPGLGEAAINLGRLLQSLARVAEAEALYRRFADDADVGPLARFNMGTLAEETGRPELAIEWYETAARQGVTDAHYNCARLLELRGERAAALRHLLRYAHSTSRSAR